MTSSLDFFGLTLWRDSNKQCWYEIHGGPNDGAFLCVYGDPSEDETRRIAKKVAKGAMHRDTYFDSREEAEKHHNVHINQLVIFREADTWLRRTANMVTRLSALALALYMAIFTVTTTGELQTGSAWACAFAVIVWGYMGFRHWGKYRRK